MAIEGQPRHQSLDHGQTTNGIDSFKNFVEQRNHDVLVALMGRSPEDKPRSLAGRQAEILVTKFQRRDVKERIMRIKK